MLRRCTHSPAAASAPPAAIAAATRAAGGTTSQPWSHAYLRKNTTPRNSTTAPTQLAQFWPISSSSDRVGDSSFVDGTGGGSTTAGRATDTSAKGTRGGGAAARGGNGGGCIVAPCTCGPLTARDCSRTAAS